MSPLLLIYGNGFQADCIVILRTYHYFFISLGAMKGRIIFFPGSKDNLHTPERKPSDIKTINCSKIDGVLKIYEEYLAT